MAYTRVKTESEIQAIRESGQMLATVLSLLNQNIDVGQTPKGLAEIAAKELKALGGKPAFYKYQGFPDVLCVCVNDEVVHGIPRDHTIESGDIISCDFGVDFKGMITDAAFSKLVDSSDGKKQSLLEDTNRALMSGIDAVKDGCHVGDIGYAVEQSLHGKNYGIVRDLVGHGVGHDVHEEPNIPNYGSKGEGPMLRAGMTIAIEPMVTLGSEAVMIDNDGWTVKTRDGSLAAHFEHTVLVTSDGYEILTEL